MPAPAPIWRGSLELQEQLNSPAWEFSDRVSVARTFKGPKAACIAARPPNGAFGFGDYIGLRVVHATVGPVDKGGIWGMSFRMEGLPPGEPLPPDEGGTEMTQLEFALEKHPRYAALDLDTKEAVRQAVHASSEKDRLEAESSFLAGSDADAVLGNELYGKLLVGEDHFVMYVPVYKWSVASYLPPAMDKGGYPQVPFGPFPFPSGVDWLRAGDTSQYSGHYWKLTRTWIAAKQWDPQIYPV